MSNGRQKRKSGGSTESGAGVAVDTYGGPAVDPTENVLALVDAETKFQNALRLAEAKYQDGMREAETRRLNELATQKQTFDLELAKVLRANQDAASTLLATQLKEVKNDLSDRTAKLEQFRWETGGKTSISDPAVAELTTSVRDLITKGGKASGKTEGMGIVAIIVTQTILILIAIGGLAVALRGH
jgi:hypothetical protein